MRLVARSQSQVTSYVVFSIDFIQLLLSARVLSDFSRAIAISLATDLLFSRSIFFCTESLSLRSTILVMELSIPPASLNTTEVISQGHNLPSFLIIERSALALPSAVLVRSIVL